MSILAQQLRRPKLKPKWWGSLGMVESVVRYNCMKKGFPVPVLAMPFWEGAGNKAYDVSGKMNHGTMLNGAKWVGGRDGNAISFDGTNDNILIPNSLNLNPNYISISAWINSSVLDATVDMILNKDDSVSATPQRVWQFRREATTGYLGFIVWNTTNNVGTISGTTNIANGQLVFVTGTWDGANLKVYVNGVLQNTVAFAGSLQQGQTNKVFIGRGENTDPGYWKGIINTPFIFNGALTPTQIKYLYDNPYFMYEMPEELWGYAAAVSGATHPGWLWNKSGWF